MKRRELREHIFELLFRIEFNSAEEMPEQIRMFFDSLGEVEPKDQQYIEKKYAHIIEKLPEIDKALEDTAEGWKVSRMGKADLTILRLAVYEMEYDEDVPVGVASTRRWSCPKSLAATSLPAL